MTELLGVPAIRERFSPLSVEEYHHLGELNEHGRRTELIRGIVIEKASRTPLHRFIADTARDILAAQLAPGLVIFSQDPMTTKDSEPEPDVMVVKGTQRDFRDSHPTTAELVVEVAITSMEIDRLKAQIYAEAGVAEYWIASPEDKSVEIYRRPGAKRYAECSKVSAPAVLTCAALPGVRVDLAALFA
jgi:Uma2 family endonuclease